MHFTETQLERYARHFILPEIGVSGQKQLLSSSVLVIGAGALGSAALYYLAAAGVGTIGIADDDTVSLSNLQRQIIHRNSTVGKSKIESAKQAIEELNPNVCVQKHQERVTADNIPTILEPYDFIVDGTDNFPTKFLINDACVLTKKPYVHAGIVRFGGQAFTYVPGQGPCLRCFLPSIPPPNASCSCAEAGVLGAAVGVLGSIQALEAVKYLLHMGELLTGRLLSFDGLTMQFRTVSMPNASGACPICGKQPQIVSLQNNKQVYV